MCPCPTVVERTPGYIEHADIEPENTAAQNWQSVVPFVQAFPDFQIHTVQYFISVTPTGRPLLAIICYTLEVASNYATVSLSIETGCRIIRMSTGT